MHKTVLEAKVAARNLINRKTNELAPLFIEAVKPFLGKQVLLQNGALRESFKKSLPDIKDKELHLLVRSSSGYSLLLDLKVCETVDKGHYHGAIYADELVYLGELNNGILTRLHDFAPRRTDYTVEEVQAAREAFRVADKARDEAQSKLNLWGQHDNS